MPGRLIRDLLRTARFLLRDLSTANPLTAQIRQYVSIPFQVRLRYVVRKVVRNAACPLCRPAERGGGRRADKGLRGTEALPYPLRPEENRPDMI